MPLLAGCAALPEILPDDPTKIDDLDRWDSSATFTEEGPDLVLTFEGWPAPDVPMVFLCSEPPAAIFEDDEDGGVVVGADPACVGNVRASLDRAIASVTVRIDRSLLPEELASLDVWQLVMAYEDDRGGWSLVRDILADPPGDG